MRLLILPTLYCEPDEFSALPNTRALLNSGECREAVEILEDLSRTDDGLHAPEDYRTALDWFLVVALPDLETLVWDFYDGDDDAPRLADLFDAVDLARMDAHLCSELRAAQSELN